MYVICEFEPNMDGGQWCIIAFADSLKRVEDILDTRPPAWDHKVFVVNDVLTPKRG